VAQKDGDFFRLARFGGFQKEDVMRYIEELERKLHAQRQSLETQATALRLAKRDRLRAAEQVRQARRQAQAALRVQEDLRRFREQLAEAQALAEEIEKENVQLRRRIRLLEEPNPEEPPVVPLEQLTFRYFLEGLEAEEEAGG
jgi:chromosome segregation ATPase